MSYVNLKEDAHLVDLTRSKVTVETLTETKITCTVEEKVSGSSQRHNSQENCTSDVLTIAEDLTLSPPSSHVCSCGGHVLLSCS